MATTYEERAEKDKADKIGYGEILTALVKDFAVASCRSGPGVTWLATQTRQHDLLPILPGRAPVQKSSMDN